MKFVVHCQGSDKGPWSFEEILNKLGTHEIAWTDYVFDADKKDWVMVLNHPQYAMHFHQEQEAFASKVHSKPQSNEKEPEWYVLRDDNRYGPFSYSEIIQMLQQKKLFEYDYIWNRPLMTSWERVSDVADFKPEKIRAIKEAGGLDQADVFYRRRHARANYGASVILHNNKEIWHGKSIEVSAGGAGFLLNTDTVAIGQSLFLHFKAGDGVPPFNATCTIVSKTKQDSENYRYGVKFTSISHSIQRAIKKYTDKAA